MFPPTPERAFSQQINIIDAYYFQSSYFLSFFRKMSTGTRSPQNILVCHAALSLILDLVAILQK